MACRFAVMCYNRVEVGAVIPMTIICPGGLMDMVMDSGSIDAGSIPVRGANHILSKVAELVNTMQQLLLCVNIQLKEPHE